MARGDGGKYVVLHSMVNDFPQGTVLGKEQLVSPAGTDRQGNKVEGEARRDRLLGLGAIRPAADAEAQAARVTLPPPGFTPAQQARLQSLDATLDQINRGLAAWEEKARGKQLLSGTPAEPSEDPGMD